MTDELLVIAARGGNRSAEHELVRRYERVARGIASNYFLPGGDREDLHQEARIGLLKAIRDFDPSIGSPFSSFAHLCMGRQIVTAVKTDTRLKHRRLHEAIRGNVAGADDDDELDILDLVAAPNTDPVELRDERQTHLTILRVVGEELSPVERASIVGRANGDSYATIEARLTGEGIDDRPADERAQFSPIKVVDNAIQRGRLKIERALEADRDVVPFGAAA